MSHRTSLMMSNRSWQTIRSGAARWSVLAIVLTIAAAAMLVMSDRDAAAQKGRNHSLVADPEPRLWTPVELLAPNAIIAQQGEPNDGSNDGPCPQETVTYSNHNFQSGSFVAQAGFVAQEIAAVTYTIDPLNFPIRIDRVDGLFGTQNPQVQITTHWSLLVWEGQPNNGNLVYTITSDGKNPPHMIITPPTNGIVVQAMVDPGDPDQIIVTNNGSNKFSVGFRIDQMNNPPTSSCNGGITPPPCCPHNQGSNIFPTTDTNGLQQTANNWLFARPGCGFGSLSGWYTFQQLAQFGGAPSGDWNIRALFTPTGCVTPIGACCLSNGQCLGGLTSGQCSAQGGTYQGNNTDCGTTNCPVPTGTCCLPSGSCIVTSTTNCASQGGTFVAAGGVCNTNTCRGACCVPATQQCVFTTEANCIAASGVFQGIGTNCTGACFGACCLPNGSCVQAISAGSCTSQGGTWQGGGVTCANANCPQPLGACCLGSNCLSDVSESDCVVGFGGQWLGAASTCDFNPCDPLGACCLGTSCLSDLSESDCTVGFGGVWQGAQSSCTTDPCVAGACPADIAPAPNGDNTVNVADLLLVINSWGACPAPPAQCAADIAPQPSGDGSVNVGDLLFIISNWGPCQ